jgi:hypothetical protein
MNHPGKSQTPSVRPARSADRLALHLEGLAEAQDP